MAQTDDGDGDQVSNAHVVHEAVQVINRLMSILQTQDHTGFWIELASLTEIAPPALPPGPNDCAPAAREDVTARWLYTYDIREHFDIIERRTTVDDTLIIERRVRPRPNTYRQDTPE